MTFDGSSHDNIIELFKENDRRNVRGELSELIASCEGFASSDHSAATAFLYMIDASTLSASLEYRTEDIILSFRAKLAD
jgi:hypothetical protein